MLLSRFEITRFYPRALWQHFFCTCSAPKIGDGPLLSFWVAFMAGLLYTSTPFILSFMHSESALKVCRLCLK